jgi:hypothetical protein
MVLFRFRVAFYPAFGVSCALAGAILAGCQAAPPITRVEPNVVACALQRAGDGYAGACEIPCLVNALAIDIDGPKAGVRCESGVRKVNATLSKTSERWLGTMEGKFPEDPTRFDVLPAMNVAKLPYGWFRVAAFYHDERALSLRIAANRQLPPNADDLKIIQRAKALLPNVTVWNKQDNRECPSGQTKLSVFCALMQATEEIAGGVHYRQPALQAVREVVNEVGGNRVGKHRLMDYNNHADTTLDDIYALLDKARAKLDARFR